MGRSRSPRRDRRRSRSRSRDRNRDNERRRDREERDREGREERRESRRPHDDQRSRQGERAPGKDDADTAWAQRLGDPRYNKGSAKPNESALWAQKGKSGNLWEAREGEEEIVLIGTGREEGAEATMQPVRYEAEGVQSAAVLAMEAVAADLKTKEEAEPAAEESEEDDEVSGEQESDQEGAVDKEEANFGNTGLLAAETNTINGVVVKFQVPAEARLPTKRWRLYIFKGDEVIEPLQIHRMNHYLIGRERKVCHIPSDNPSVSSQHAVICFRLVDKTKNPAAVERKMAVLPYLMDLGSVNGTFLNNKRIESQRFYQLLEGDAMQFGQSPRKYVLLHEETKMTKK